MSLSENAKAVDSFTRNFFPRFLTEEDCKKMTDEELLAELKKSTDFHQLVFPTSWHKKFPDLPKADCLDTKAYIKESPWMKKGYHFYGNGGRIEQIDAKPGGVRPVLPAPEVPTITVIQNSFSDAPTNQTSDEHPEHYPEMKVNAIMSTDSKSQG